MRIAAFLLAFVSLLPIPAAAETPLYLPNRDVAVSYRVSGRAAQQVRQLTARFSVARQLLRLETEDRDLGYLLVDPARRSARMVIPGVGQYVDLPLERDRRAAILFGEGMEFTRRDRARIVGTECTNWDVRAGRDRATLCLTAEGVLLRARGYTGDLADSTLEATRVEMRTQAASLFQLPRAAHGLNLRDVLRPLLQQR